MPLCLRHLLLLRRLLLWICSLALLRSLLSLRLSLLGRALLRMLLLATGSLLVRVCYSGLRPHLLCSSVSSLVLGVRRSSLAWVALLRVRMLHGHLLS